MDWSIVGTSGQQTKGPIFAEFFDIINPLQHIPFVSAIYRAITGDQIQTRPRFLGGALFGGPASAMGASIASLFEEASGANLGQRIAELVNDFTGGGDEEENTPTREQSRWAIGIRRKGSVYRRPYGRLIRRTNTANAPATHACTPEKFDLRQGVFDTSIAAATRATLKPMPSIGNRKTIAAPRVSDAGRQT